MTTRPKIRKNRDGSAKIAECSKGHDGNRKYYESTQDWWECAGCGDFRHVEAIAADQSPGARK